MCQLPSCAFEEGTLSQDDQYRSLVFKDIQTAVYILGSLYIEEAVSLDIHGQLLEGQVAGMRDCVFLFNLLSLNCAISDVCSLTGGEKKKSGKRCCREVSAFHYT